LGIEPGRSYSEYSFRALLCVPEDIDDMRKAVVDFPDESVFGWHSRHVPARPDFTVCRLLKQFVQYFKRFTCIHLASLVFGALINIMSLFAHRTFDRWSTSIGGGRKCFSSYFRYEDFGVDEVKCRYSSFRLSRAYGIFVEELQNFILFWLNIGF
jgi:hypothetical protein